MMRVRWCCIAAVAAQSPQVGDHIQLWECGASGRQSFDLGNSSNPNLLNHLIIRGQEGDNPPYVWDISGPSNNTGTQVHVWGAYSKPVHTNQLWSIDSTTNLIRSLYNGMCLGVVGAIAGADLLLTQCDASNPLQQFVYSAATGVFTFNGANPPLCVDAGSKANCTLPPYNSYAYCNSSLPPTTRAADLASRLTVTDFAMLLPNSNPGVPRFGIPPIDYNEALHGESSS